MPFFVQECMPVQRPVLVGVSTECSRAVLGQGCLARCDARLDIRSRRAENCGRPTIAVPDPDGRVARGDSTGCSFWTRFACPSLCLAPLATQRRKLWRFHRCQWSRQCRNRRGSAVCPCRVHRCSLLVRLLACQVVERRQLRTALTDHKTVEVSQLQWCVEETTTGVLKLKVMIAKGESLVLPSHHSLRLRAEVLFDNVCGCRHMRATDVMTCGKRALVFVYGNVGNGCSFLLRASMLECSLPNVTHLRLASVHGGFQVACH